MRYVVTESEQGWIQWIGDAESPEAAIKSACDEIGGVELAENSDWIFTAHEAPEGWDTVDSQVEYMLTYSILKKMPAVLACGVSGPAD